MVASRWVLTRHRVGGKLPGIALAAQGAGRAGRTRGGGRRSADTGYTCSQCHSRRGGMCLRGGVLLVPQGGCREGRRTAGMDEVQLISHVRGVWIVAGRLPNDLQLGQGRDSRQQSV